MEALLDMLADNESVGGRAVTSAAIALFALLVAWLLRVAVGRRADDDPYTRYHLRKAAGYVAFVLALVALAVVWRPFAGRIGVVVGFTAAGIAFAMQEVIGAIAGWFNILSGRIFRVGDRIEMGGVKGDVIDITPLRTKVLEMGTPGDTDAWVQGRQHTGRIVALSNKLTFTAPVFNYSAAFEYIWEELTVPVAYDSDWKQAEQVLLQEARQVSGTAGARDAMRRVAAKYPVPVTELEPRVFVRATDDYLELAARFIVPVRTARSVKDALTRRIWKRLEEADIEIASETIDATLRRPRTGSDDGDAE